MGAQFSGVIGLAAAAVDRDGLEAHRPGELHAEVPQATDAQYRHAIAGQGFRVTQRVVGGDAGAPHGAASASESSAGIRAKALTGTVTDSAYPPGYCQLGTFPFAQ